MDHTKLGRKSVSFLCDLTAIDTVITDSQASESLVAELRSHDVEVIIAPNA